MAKGNLPEHMDKLGTTFSHKRVRWGNHDMLRAGRMWCYENNILTPVEIQNKLMKII
jgi:hypothetical protein